MAQGFHNLFIMTLADLYVAGRVAAGSLWDLRLGISILETYRINNLEANSFHVVQSH